MYRIVPADREGPLGDIWHTRGLGASAAEVVMYGKNKYRETEHDLWQYIKGLKEKKPQTEPMLAGLRAEPEIAAAWELHTKRQGESMNLIDMEHDFLRMQCDWMSWELDLACDFKYSYGDRTFANANDAGMMSGNVIEQGGPLNHWWVAAQHQLMILDMPSIRYYVWKEGRAPIDLLIKRDDEYIGHYRKKAIDWWTSYVAFDTPPPRGRKLKLA